MWGGACRGECYRFRERRVFVEDSTIYVSLEPCSHYGKTLLASELSYPERDSTGGGRLLGSLFPEVSGRGVRMLREAGVEVVTGVMEEEARVVEQGVYDATNERPSLYYLEMGAERGWVYRSFAYGRVGAGHGFVFSGDFPLGA